MKYIQSFYQYPVTFSSIGKTIPARSAQGPMRNIAEIEDKELERLEQSEPFFRELVSTKKLRVLNHLPDSYVSSAQRINEANDEIARLKAENEALKAQAGKPAPADPDEDASAAADEDEKKEKAYGEMTYAELQDACKYAGIEYKNKKKAELLEALIAFTNQ